VETGNGTETPVVEADTLSLSLSAVAKKEDFASAHRDHPQPRASRSSRSSRDHLVILINIIIVIVIAERI